MVTLLIEKIHKIANTQNKKTLSGIKRQYIFVTQTFIKFTHKRTSHKS